MSLSFSRRVPCLCLALPLYLSCSLFLLIFLSRALSEKHPQTGSGEGGRFFSRGNVLTWWLHPHTCTAHSLSHTDTPTHKCTTHTHTHTHTRTHTLTHTHSLSLTQTHTHTHAHTYTHEHPPRGQFCAKIPACRGSWSDFDSTKCGGLLGPVS